MRVAYQGIPGAYSEEAIIQRWGDIAEPIPRPCLEDVFDSVESGAADAGMVPVENTIEGTITRTNDLLKDRSLTVLGETVLRVMHCLIANPGVGLDDIKYVYSHPQALGQTRVYLASHGFEAVDYNDTAGAVKMIHDAGLGNAAAVASKRAAELYGMNILSENIEDNKENYTRFLHIGYGATKSTGRDKTSLAFTIENRTSNLIPILQVLADRHLNITKIESRPYQGRPWEYIFFIDIEGHRCDSLITEAIKEIQAHTGSLKVIGSYPRA